MAITLTTSSVSSVYNATSQTTLSITGPTTVASGDTVIVWLGLYCSGAGLDFTATYGGVSMNSLGTALNYQNFGAYNHLKGFYLQGVSAAGGTGATIAITCTAGSSLNGYNATVQSFAGVATGTLTGQTTSNSGSSSMTQSATTTNGHTVSNAFVSGYTGGSTTFGTYSPTQDQVLNLGASPPAGEVPSESIIAGHGSATGSTLAFSANNSAGGAWAGGAVDLTPASSGGSSYTATPTTATIHITGGTSGTNPNFLDPHTATIHLTGGTPVITNLPPHPIFDVAGNPGTIAAGTTGSYSSTSYPFTLPTTGGSALPAITANDTVLLWCHSFGASPGLTATCNGVSMTLVGGASFQYYNVSGVDLELWCFYLQNVAAGIPTIVLSSTNSGSPPYVKSEVVAYKNVGTLTSPSLSTNSGSSGTALSQTVTGTAAGHCVSQVFANLVYNNSANALSGYSQTQHSNDNTSDVFYYPTLLVGEALPTTTSVSFAATAAVNSQWGAAALDLPPTSSSTSMAPTTAHVNITGGIPTITNRPPSTIFPFNFPQAFTLSPVTVAPTTATIHITGSTPTITNLSPAPTWKSGGSGTPTNATIFASNTPLTIVGPLTAAQGNVVVVWAHSQTGQTPATFTATYAGHPMTLVGGAGYTYYTNFGLYMTLWCFWITVDGTTVPTGSQNIVITDPSTGSWIKASSEAYSNVGAISGSLFKDTNAGAAGTAMSLTIPSVASGNAISQAFAAVSYNAVDNFAAYSQNVRFYDNTNDSFYYDPLIIGDSTNAGTVSFTASQSVSTNWGGAAITLIGQGNTNVTVRPASAVIHLTGGTPVTTNGGASLSVAPTTATIHITGGTSTLAGNPLAGVLTKLGLGQPVHILGIGDSTYVGYGDYQDPQIGDHRGWMGRFGALLGRYYNNTVNDFGWSGTSLGWQPGTAWNTGTTGGGINVYNLGGVGQTVSSYESDISSGCFSTTAINPLNGQPYWSTSQNPDIIFLCDGFNDMGVPPNNFINNGATQVTFPQKRANVISGIQSFVTQLQGLFPNAQIVVTTQNMTSEQINANSNNTQDNDWAQMWLAMAQAYGLTPTHAPDAIDMTYQPIITPALQHTTTTGVSLLDTRQAFLPYIHDVSGGVPGGFNASAPTQSTTLGGAYWNPSRGGAGSYSGSGGQGNQSVTYDTVHPNSQGYDLEGQFVFDQLTSFQPVMLFPYAQGATPGSPTITITGGTPGVKITGPIFFAPTTATIHLTGSTPVVGLTNNKLAAPTTATIHLTGGTSTVVKTANVGVAPTTATVHLTGGTSTVIATANVKVAPTSAVIHINSSATFPAQFPLQFPPVSTITLTGNNVIAPAPATIAIHGNPPVVVATNNKWAIPATATIHITGSTAAVNASVHVAPTTAIIHITRGTSIVTSPVNVRPTTATIHLAGGTSTIVATGPHFFTPTTATIHLIGSTAAVSAPFRVTPATATIHLTGGTPSLTFTGPQNIAPATAHVRLTGGTPALSIPVRVIPTTATVRLIEGTPAVGIPVKAVPATATIHLVGGLAKVSAPFSTVPTTATVHLSGGTPVLRFNTQVIPTTARVVLSGGIPGVLHTANVGVAPTTSRVRISGQVSPVTNHPPNVSVAPVSARILVFGNQSPIVATQNIGPVGGKLPVFTGPELGVLAVAKQDLNKIITTIYEDFQDFENWLGGL